MGRRRRAAREGGVPGGVRWGNAAKDERYAPLQQRLEAHPKIATPTIVLHGDQDGASLPASTENQASSFSGHYQRKLLRGVGHFIPHERPAVIAEALASTGSQ